MFKREDALELRNSAPPLDCALAAPDSALLRKYLEHYNLRFSLDEGAVQHCLGQFSGGGERLVAQYFAPPAPRGTAFLLHGYLDHAGIFANLIEFCLAHGYAAFICDLPGHGLSSGEMGGVDNFARYCDALSQAFALARAQQLPRPWFAIGQSTGGAILMDSILHHHLMETHAPEGFALLAPLLRTLHHRYSRLLFLLGGRFLQGMPRQFSSSSHDQEFLDFLRGGDRLQSNRIPRSWIAAMFDYVKRFDSAAASPAPLTIIQGTADDTVDWKFNLPAIRAKFPAANEVLVPGARHHLVNETREFRKPVFNAIARALFRKI